jgi:hypothetical protein
MAPAILPHLIGFTILTIIPLFFPRLNLFGIWPIIAPSLFDVGILLFVKKCVNIRFIYWPLSLMLLVLTAIYYIIYPACVISNQCNVSPFITNVWFLDYLGMILLTMTFHLLTGERRLEYIGLLIYSPMPIETRIYLEHNQKESKGKVKHFWIIFILWGIITTLWLSIFIFWGRPYRMTNVLAQFWENNDLVANTTPSLNDLPFCVAWLMTVITVLPVSYRHCEIISNKTTLKNWQKWIACALILFINNVNGSTGITIAMYLEYHL